MGMKNITEATLGDTMYFQHEASSSSSSSLEPLERIKMPVQMVFASFYPTDDGSFDQLRVAIERLRLNDASVTVFPETSTALGMGFRCGFLGVLHMDVFRQRLADEQQMNVLITAPMVPYQVGSFVVLVGYYTHHGSLNHGSFVLHAISDRRLG